MSSDIRLQAYRGAEAGSLVDGLAALRIKVFADWPYLYEGDREYEARYLGHFLAGEGAFVAAAFDGDQLVGAATAAPLVQHMDDIAEPVRALDLDPAAIFYLSESVLLSEYRGSGIGHRFFDMREAEAMRQGFRASMFCAVDRQPDDPRRPSDARSLEPFWRTRGYRKIDGPKAHISWRERGHSDESDHTLTLWLRDLNGE
ncbi:GNAT family N-acetyltransferase [Notoacmeibacter ruber]|uniref:GNAT family N-acetyltransferase n=1 Tax=Notoacmeibacter ruber TaxID=2670375 RepID=A0A3L7JDA2_9HYPH|nr:GNAT family N-acetyltransferase [Notoacmeibacter ruber]RLQ88285.1 GNAT family N-acetyltransferase [Notoacmeibacter ruber]